MSKPYQTACTLLSNTYELLENRSRENAATLSSSEMDAFAIGVTSSLKDIQEQCSQLKDKVDKIAITFEKLDGRTNQFSSQQSIDTMVKTLFTITKDRTEHSKFVRGLSERLLSLKKQVKHAEDTNQGPESIEPKQFERIQVACELQEADQVLCIFERRRQKFFDKCDLNDRRIDRMQKLKDTSEDLKNQHADLCKEWKDVLHRIKEIQDILGTEFVEVPEFPPSGSVIEEEHPVEDEAVNKEDTSRDEAAPSTPDINFRNIMMVLESRYTEI
ncbi:hypothetical protein ACLMJK_001636 [Lecanora helva]